MIKSFSSELSGNSKKQIGNVQDLLSEDEHANLKAVKRKKLKKFVMFFIPIFTVLVISLIYFLYKYNNSKSRDNLSFFEFIDEEIFEDNEYGEYLEFSGCEKSIQNIIPDVTVPEGFKATYFIAPNGLTTPSDLIIDDEGNLLINEVRGGGVSKVSEDGNIRLWAETGVTYSIDIASDGSIYTYGFPDASVYRIFSNGTSELIVQDSKNLGSSYESSIAVNSSGEIYVLRNSHITKKADLVMITEEGDVTNLLSDMNQFSAIAFNDKDELFGTTGNELVKIDTETGEIKGMYSIRRGFFAFHGLVIDSSDNFYLTTKDSIYKIDNSGRVTLIAKGFKGLEGITVDSRGVIYTVSRKDNGLYKVTQDKIECVVVPNYISTPQAIAFGINGELFINQDETGEIVSFSSEGEVLAYYGAITYQPPLADMAIDPNGNIIFTESAPGFEDSVIEIEPDEPNLDHEDYLKLEDFAKPSGVAIHGENIYIAESDLGRVSWFSKAEGKKTFIEVGENLGTMNFDQEGNLLVLAMSKLYKVSPEREKEVILNSEAEGDWFTFVTTDLENTIYVSSSKGVSKIDEGNVSIFVGGLKCAMGLAFDREGSLYVADDCLNAIIKIEGNLN